MDRIKQKIKALFLDRDGTINYVVKKHSGLHNELIDDSPFNVSELEFVPVIKNLVEDARKKGYKILIVTNQPSILKGGFTMKEYEDITTEVCKHLDIERQDVFTCFHREGYSLPCQCRKPAPGLLLMAKGMFDIDLEGSWIVGDSSTDIKAGQAAGVKTIYIRREENEKQIGNKKDQEKMEKEGVKPNNFVNSIEEVSSLI